MKTRRARYIGFADDKFVFEVLKSDTKLYLYSSEVNCLLTKYELMEKMASKIGDIFQVGFYYPEFSYHVIIRADDNGNKKFILYDSLTGLPTDCVYRDWDDIPMEYNGRAVFKFARRLLLKEVTEDGKSIYAD